MTRGAQSENGRKTIGKTGRKREENGKKRARKGQEKGEKRARKGQEKGNDILDMISTTPTVSVAGIASELSLSVKAVRRRIEKLKASGHLRRIGPDKGGHWKVIK
ncbi:MAG: HTH domain-containing protein [Opitutaceae bacterium]|nr:HTH domain-containing protein [Opitutaceae bacterium]